MPTLRLAQWIRTACQLEATARKPGNVHPQAAFRDLCYSDFVASADAASPCLARAGEIGIGAAVESAIRATRDVVRTNTNLGIALLIAPLAAVPPEKTLSAGIAAVLAETTIADARAVYRGILLASPGGMGAVAEQDITSEPALTLIEVMRLAADRDRVARQYVTRFADVLEIGRERWHAQWAACREDWESSVIGLHLALLAEFPDSLIARKCGPEVAQEATCRARSVLQREWPTVAAREECAEFDRWLRADGHRRNPGTTADLVAATLFALLRDDQWKLPRSICLPDAPTV